MRIAFSIMTLAAGAVGGALLLAPQPQDAELAVVADVGAGGVARLEAREPAVDSNGPEGTRFFGFAMPSRSSELARNDQSPAAVPTPVQVSRTQAAPPSRAEVAAAGANGAAWSTNIVLAHGAAPKLAPSHVVGNGASNPVPGTRDVPRDALIRDLQRELKRVGCYHGEFDGDWGGNSKRGLQAFLERLNSALPTNDPDLIQLTLVRGFQGVACKSFDGTTTAARTAPARNDSIRAAGVPTAPVAVRALPQTEVQSVAIRPAPALPQTAQVIPSQTPTSAPFEGRMAIGALPGTSTSSEAAAADGAPGQPPADASAVPPVAAKLIKPKPQQTARRERNWTANFFNP